MKQEKKKSTRKRYSKTAGRHVKRIYSVLQQLEQPTHYDNKTGKITHFGYEKGKLRMRKGVGAEKAHQDVKRLVKIKYKGKNRANIGKATLSKEGRYMMVIGSPAARGWDELTRAQQKRTVEHTQQVLFDYLKSKNRRFTAEQIQKRIPEQLRMAQEMLANTIENGTRNLETLQLDGLKRKLHILQRIGEQTIIQQIVRESREAGANKEKIERERKKREKMGKILRWENGLATRKATTPSPAPQAQRRDALGLIPEWRSDTNARIIRETAATRTTDNHSPTWAYRAGATVARTWRSLRKRWKR